MHHQAREQTEAEWEHLAGGRIRRAFEDGEDLEEVEWVTRVRQAWSCSKLTVAGYVPASNECMFTSPCPVHM